MSGRRLGGRAGVALVVLTALLFAAAGLSGYVRSEFVDERQFSVRAAAALEHRDVRTLLADRTTGVLTRSVAPQVLVVRPLVVSALAAAVGTPTFRRVFTRVVRDRHEVLINGETTFVLDLVPSDGLLLGALRTVSPRAAEAIPQAVGAIPGVPQLPVITLDPRNFEHRIARVLNTVASLWWPLLAASLLAAGASAALAGGVRAALLNLGIATAGAGLLVAALVTGFGWLVVGHAAYAADLSDASERRAVGALWSALFGDLRGAGLFAALGGAVLVVLASGRLAAHRLADVARWLRDLARQPGPRARRARAAGLIAVGGLVLLAPGLALRGVVGVAGAVLVLVGAVGLAGRSGPVPGSEQHGSKSPLFTAGAVAAVVVATAIAIAVIVPGPTPPSVAVVSTADGCNGSRVLCDRRLDQVVFPATHNSYAAADQPQWFFPTHSHGIARQLQDGIRALLVDVHFGVRDGDSGRVRTDLGYEGSSRNKVRRQLSPEALRTANRLAGGVGLGDVSGPRRPYLCHTLCELGAEPLGDQLQLVRRFLDANAREVVILFVEPYVPVEEIERGLEDANLLSYAAELRRDRLPTLGRLVETGKRLVVLAEQDGGKRPWYLKGFSFAQDTPLGAKRRSELGCRRFRGERDSPLLLVNHWIPPFPPSVEDNEAIGGRVLRQRLTRCQRQRRQLPNIVAVDFYERSGVIAEAGRLNARRRP